jgi:uncharacterized protein YyaL (SSP411 family)
MSNRLAQQTSPYLLQHQHNPVDWYPWGPEALERARAEEKPIFLSIGYSACHWCHVMEHESFENAEIAAALNEAFVCIKVDREERPDLDQIYMAAVQMLTGRGGWPMSVFLTPELQPFYGGTYWPPQPKHGMPGFDQVIAAVAAAWRDRREHAIATAGEIADQMRNMAAPEMEPGELSLDLIANAAARMEQSFDFTNGGFGGAPKFPHAMDLQLLLRYWQRTGRAGALSMVKLTLERMHAGGIYDHLGGGFARYSVDARWFAPHFEKMLYDNALLAGAYLDGFLATGDEAYARVLRETLDYILRDMTDAAGGFHSAEDADSEGEEGKYYLWTPREIAEVIGPVKATRFCQIYDVSEAGNFEQRNILHLSQTLAYWAAEFGVNETELRAEMKALRAELLAAREKRIKPGKDDKVLVNWNSLAIDALARAAGALDEPRYLEAAVRAADIILAEMRDANGRLLHTWRAGRASLAAYLDDYAGLAGALVTLYEATFDERFLREAMQLADVLLAQFHDPRAGGFFFTAADHEQLLARHKDWQDSSVPSGSALAATVLLRLARLTGNETYESAALETMQSLASLMSESPLAVGQMLLCVDFYLGPAREIVLLGDLASPTTQSILQALRQAYLPRRVVAFHNAGEPVANDSPLAPLLAGKTARADEPTLFVCEQFTCQAPVVGAQAARDIIEELAQLQADSGLR